jgi:hypothetical protein
MSADVTGEITDHLQKAVELAIAADGNTVGNYALITQATVNPDGTFIVTWQRYYAPPMGDGGNG